jgi:hypothetical protein
MARMLPLIASTFPGSPGQIPQPPLRPAVDLADRDSAAPTDVVRLRGRVSDRQGQRAFVGFPARDPIGGRRRMRATISSGIGSLLSVMASHVRRSTKFGADAPHHFLRLLPAHGARRLCLPSVSLQDRVWTGFQYSSIIRTPPGHPAPTSPAPGPSRARMTLSRISPYLSRRPCLSALLSGSRIVTGTRTDSREERNFG